jgi:hypothetical protein
MKAERKKLKMVRTKFVHSECRWVAHFDGDEDDPWKHGWGNTEIEAVQDCLQRNATPGDAAPRGNAPMSTRQRGPASVAWITRRSNNLCVTGIAGTAIMNAERKRAAELVEALMDRTPWKNQLWARAALATAARAIRRGRLLTDREKRLNLAKAMRESCTS